MEDEKLKKAVELTKKVNGVFGEKVKNIINELIRLNKEDRELFNISITYIIHNIITPLDSDSRNRLLDQLKETMNTLDVMGWPEPTKETLKEFGDKIIKREKLDYIG